ncbi:hypothetical protein VP01_2506g1 [Puccinia sorghi]|uniref:Uncharacterized protein n=1 Tax=Puccinia sorghi TaxID=27349 RepID=A0A0L6V7G3_9BASI|nr:hypothetical protein VP01_2506g1 [Puccinia sorghi]
MPSIRRLFFFLGVESTIGVPTLGHIISHSDEILNCHEFNPAAPPGSIPRYELVPAGNHEEGVLSSRKRARVDQPSAARMVKPGSLGIQGASCTQVMNPVAADWIGHERPIISSNRSQQDKRVGNEQPASVGNLPRPLGHLRPDFLALHSNVGTAGLWNHGQVPGRNQPYAKQHDVVLPQDHDINLIPPSLDQIMQEYFDDPRNMAALDHMSNENSESQQLPMEAVIDHSTHFNLPDHQVYDQAHLMNPDAGLLKSTVHLHHINTNPARGFSTESPPHHSSSSSHTHPLQFSSDPAAQNKAKEISLQKIIDLYQLNYLIAIGKIYLEYLSLPSTSREIAKDVKDLYPVNIQIVPLEKGMGSGDRTSLVILLNSQGELYDLEVILSSIKDLQDAILNLHVRTGWKQFTPIAHLDTSIASEYQKLMDWLFEEVFNPKNKHPVLGKTRLKISDHLEYGVVQSGIIKLLARPEYVDELSELIVRSWFEKDLPTDGGTKNFEKENVFEKTSGTGSSRRKMLIPNAKVKALKAADSAIETSSVNPHFLRITQLMTQEIESGLKKVDTHIYLRIGNFKLYGIHEDINPLSLRSEVQDAEQVLLGKEQSKTKRVLNWMNHNLKGIPTATKHAGFIMKKVEEFSRQERYSKNEKHQQAFKIPIFGSFSQELLDTNTPYPYYHPVQLSIIRALAISYSDNNFKYEETAMALCGYWLECTHPEVWVQNFKNSEGYSFFLYAAFSEQV